MTRDRNSKRPRTKAAALLCCVVLLIFALAGCGTSSSESSASHVSGTTTANTAEASEMFTDRDLDPSYDEASATKITLNGESATVDGTGAAVNGSTITIEEEGVYILSGTWKGQVCVEAEDSAKIQIVLEHADITNNGSAALYVKQAAKVFVALAEGSENSLATTGTYSADGETNVDGVIFSKEDICIQGTGTLTVTGEEGNGIVSKDDLKVTGGTITVDVPHHGLEGKDSVRIADGDITITCDQDGIHSDNTEKEGNGFVYIFGGSLTLEVGDDGVHAANSLTVDGGTIDIKKSYEGLEGHTIAINGGDITIVASDDGLNAAGGNDGSGVTGAMAEEDPFATDEEAYLAINGGTLTVNADGDGLDSNGDLTVSGGTVYVAGPTNDGNGALDYNGTGTITGGTVVATGMSGMAMNFGEHSTQGSMLATSSTTTSDEVVLKDSDGNTLVTFAPGKAYNSILISTPDIKVGETYTLSAGSLSGEVEMTSLIMGSGSGMGGGGMGGQPGGQGGPGGGPQDMPGGGPGERTEEQQ